MDVDTVVETTEFFNPTTTQNIFTFNKGEKNLKPQDI